ncbi:M1 family peptidase [bacterium]|nr:MAG: M1 family peptidase [bacterium]
MKSLLTFAFVCINMVAFAQPSAHYWQQRVSYDMDINMLEDKNQYEGKQRLTYFNNSPDTLYKVYYHLYFNAFQPNSMMDKRSREILDPDGRVRDRIYHLSDEEIGFQKVNSLTQNGKLTEFKIEETTLEVTLAEPILPGAETVFEMDFHAQVPLQIRRSGRDNAEGVRFSMTQWYPKMAEYDENGWHTSPYIGREFYAPYGEFNVKITIDSSYTIGGTGVLQNPTEIGHGYAPQSDVNTNGKSRLTWHFYAHNVHDFAWAADPEFQHYSVKGPNNIDVHVIFQHTAPQANWLKLGEYTAKAIQYMNENFGVYPYEQFTVIQGGDGGMEYPMTTLITGHRSLGSLVGVTAHELAHMWYYGVLGFNESYYSWMDEGFTEYSSSEVMAALFNQKGDPHARTYGSYLFLKYRQMEEPLTTHSDQYETNTAYSTAAYTYGHIFLNQLSYIVGQDVMRKSLLRFFNEWKFKHPDGEDLIHIVEKESGMVLDWYYDHWIKSTHTIDYAISKTSIKPNNSSITLKRVGDHPMPVDVYVQYKDGSYDFYTIPLVSQRGEKRFEGNVVYTIAKDWPWTHPEYNLELNHPGKQIERIEIDPTLRMADINRLNNTWPFPNDKKFMQPAQAYWNSYGSSWRPQFWFGEQAGVIAGYRAYGNYIFDQYAYEASFRLTSGSVSNYDAKQTDVDYTFKLSLPSKYSGKSATINFEAKRYYGVFQNELSFDKYIGPYGAWSKKRRFFSFSLFHQERTADRTIGLFDAWDRFTVVGARLAYEIGNPESNGIKLNSQIASSGKLLGASYSSLTANKTFDFGHTFSTRLGLNVATGSTLLPVQYRFTASGPSLDGMWNNPTWFSVANIDASLTNDLHLVPTGNNGLIGYGLSGIGSTDIPGNNHFSAVIWNEWTPFSSKWMKPTTFEFVTGLGRSWNGNFIDDQPFGKNSADKTLLASMFVGLSYDAGSLPMFNRWRPQSTFIQNLEFSLRMPFYMNGLQGRSDWNTFLLFGVSNNF